jgi:hypothetical protein
LKKIISLLIPALMIFTLICFFYPEKTYACSCVYEQDSIKALDQAKAVFSGNVLEVKQKILDSDGILEYRDAVLFNVEQSWKGISQSQVIVNTYSGGQSACGNEFKAGQTYLVFANGDNNSLQTSICSLTKELSSANLQLNQIGQGTKPIEHANLKAAMNKLDYSNKLVYVTAAYHRLEKYHLKEVLFGLFIMVVGIILVILRRTAFRQRK